MAEVVSRGECVCGSSDGYTVHSDGSEHCYVCETTFVFSDGQTNNNTPIDPELLTDSEYITLSARNITEATCRKYRYGVGSYTDKWNRTTKCQIAPYYKDGQLTAQHLRFPDKGFSWLGDSKGVEFFGQHLFRHGGKRLIITEGELDCLSVSQAQGNKWPVVSIPSGVNSAKKAFKEHLEWIESYEEVVIWFDDDEPGRKAADECALLLSPGKARIVKTPGEHKDANDLLKARQVAELVACLWEAKVYRPDGIVAGVELKERMYERFHKGVVRGFSFPYPLLDNMMFGLHKGKLLTLTAGSGIGKSTLAQELGYHLNMVHKQSVGIVALEENLEQSSMKQMGIALNKPLHLDMEGVTEDAWNEAFDQTIGNDRTFLYDHFGSLDSDNLLSKLRYLVVGCGVDFIILDHVSIVVSGADEGNERKAIDVLMTNLRSLVENTGVGMILISHLTRTGGKNAKSHEEGGRVTLGQLRGSGAIAQLSDFVVGLERDQQGQDSDVTTPRILKNRHAGRLGSAGYLKYFHDTGRLLNHIPDKPPEPPENEDF